MNFSISFNRYIPQILTTSTIRINIGYFVCFWDENIITQFSQSNETARDL
jgi:hypothetical protein